MEPTQELVDSIFRERVYRARRTPPEEKLLDGSRLFDLCCRIMADGIRNENPEADDQRVQELLVQRIALLRRLEEYRYIQCDRHGTRALFDEIRGSIPPL